MPQFNEFKDAGRELMVRFTCVRCGLQVIEELTDDKIGSESYGYLSAIKKPAGWFELTHHRLLCLKCYEQFMRFMKNERMEGEQ